MALFQSIRLKNFLSFGPKGMTLPLLPLNVLIGPNGSGKSNLIEAFRVFQSAPTDVTGVFRGTGPIEDWLWKGNGNRREIPIAELEAKLEGRTATEPLLYKYLFTSNNNHFEFIDEAIENPLDFPDYKGPLFYYRYQRGNPTILIAELLDESSANVPESSGKYRPLDRNTVRSDRSIMSQFKDPVFYPELNYLGETLPQIRIYTDWSKGRYSAFRKAQEIDLSGEFLREDFANLPHVINRLDALEPDAMAEITEYFGRFYEGVENLKTRVEASTIQLLLKEKGLYPIPATRLSDGTLNFLCLCVLLLHPSPPPLMIFDEPELGLHPDILPMLGEMLISASERTQLIVTTHSTGLVEAIGETTPESVVVCEREEGGTRMERLDPEQLKVWLERYTLGELWTKGIIRGNRW